jgi:acyl-CoA dehydrogenase
MTAERCLLAGEALRLGYATPARAVKYVKDRDVSGRPIGQNQGIQHPLAAAYMYLEAVKLATYHAAKLYDASGQDGNHTACSGFSLQQCQVSCRRSRFQRLRN